MSDEPKGESIAERIEGMANTFAGVLSEHVDSVVILVTYRNEARETLAYHAHRGNWYAVRGQVAAFDKIEDARQSAWASKSEPGEGA